MVENEREKNGENQRYKKRHRKVKERDMKHLTVLHTETGV